ncbi:MAG: hypothetical protein SOT81_04540 [Treponema sp.]|nr:hypothetical protein [Treponema sp.]
MKRFHLLAAFFLIFSFCPGVFALDSGVSNGISDSDLRQGYESFRNEDWISATMFFRKAVSSASNVTDENYFMLIKSEIYSGEYKMAQSDCEKFLSLFPLSVYANHVQYQNGRMLHLLEKNEDAVLALSDFCRQHYDDELYPLALYWIAESFYDEYNFDSAQGIYKRIVSEFPDCEKSRDSQYKLDLIAQRAREEKLLYLLKVIGEENLSTREEYERQIKIYELEDKLGLNRQVIDLQARIDELEETLAEKNSVSANPSDEKSYSDSENQNSDKNSDSRKFDVAADLNSAAEEFSKSENESSESVRLADESSFNIRKNSVAQDLAALKKKAKQLQYLLESQNFDEQNLNGEK